MLVLITSLLLVSAAPAAPLHCRVTASSSPRHCAITVPAGRAVRACGPADAQAGHCAKDAGKHVAWVVASNGAKCKISKKRTDWSREVVVRMKRKGASGAAACDLYVEVQ